MKIFIEFSLEQPKGGVQFVVPPGTTPDIMVRVSLAEPIPVLTTPPFHSNMHMSSHMVGRTRHG